MLAEAYGPPSSPPPPPRWCAAAAADVVTPWHGAVGDWFVLHTRSRQEKVLADELGCKGLVAYLPQHRESRSHGGRRVKVELPLFPGYVFLRGTIEQAYAADRTRRVAQIIRVHDQARLEWELANIYSALGRDAPFGTHAGLTQGTRVAVRSGPFVGLQGMIEGWASSDRLILQIKMLGRAISLEVDGSLLDPID